MSQSLFLYFLGSDSGTHVVKTAPRFPSVPPSKPMVEGGEQSSPPTHPRWAPTGREVVCVFVTVAKTLCYLAVRGCIRCVSGVRDKERQSRLWSSSGGSRQQQRRQQRPSPASFVSECRGNGRHRGSSSPRQSKQDRWAQAWHD